MWAKREANDRMHIPASVSMNFILASIKQSLSFNTSPPHTSKDQLSTGIGSYSSQSGHPKSPNPDLYNSDRVCPPHTHTSRPGRGIYSPNTLILQSTEPTVTANRCSDKAYRQSRCVRYSAIPCSSRPLFVHGQTST